MKALVTGASGYLGGRIAEALVGAGHEVRGYVREPARWTSRPPGVDAIAGDVRDDDAFARAAQGCDAVVHAAGLVRAWARDRREFERVNLEGLRNAVEACRRTGARLVYASSFLALGPTDGAVFDEETPRATTRFFNDYERSKWLGDQLARHVASRGFPIVRLYPGVVYGPGALTPGNHVVGLLLRHVRGRLGGLPGGGRRRQCFAYIEDVASGFVAAAERGAPGSAYLLGGENRTVRELFEVFASVSGIPPPRRGLPLWTAVLAGRLQRWKADLTGVEPDFTDEVVRIYGHDWAYSSARAQHEIGYAITPLRDGLDATWRWLSRSEGVLAAS